MFLKLSLICLLVGQGFADLGQGYYNPNTNNQGQGLGQGYNNNPGLGQGNNNQELGQGYGNNRNGGLNQGSGYNGGLSRNPSLGQGGLNTNNGYPNSGYSGLGNSQSSGSGYSGLEQQSQSSGAGYYGQSTQVLPGETVRASGLRRSDEIQRTPQYNSDDNIGINQRPSSEGTGYYGRQKREVEFPKQLNKRSPNLGQQTSSDIVTKLGQPEQIIAHGPGQAQNELSTAGALGQPEQSLAGGSDQLSRSGSLNSQPDSLTRNLNQRPELIKQSELNRQLRAKRYVEREPYRKTCNTYYGKYICYRLYEKDALIPNEFTCWSTYLGKQNCTETENVLYLDRRNVEVDPSELDRRFTDTSSSDYIRRDRQRERTQDEEFGAVEKNLHNRRTNERQLPSDRLDREGYARPTLSSGSRRLNSQVYDDREVRRQN